MLHWSAWWFRLDNIDTLIQWLNSVILSIDITPFGIRHILLKYMRNEYAYYRTKNIEYTLFLISIPFVIEEIVVELKNSLKGLNFMIRVCKMIK